MKITTTHEGKGPFIPITFYSNRTKNGNNNK